LAATAAGWEGIYCPVGRKRYGRHTFKQEWNFGGLMPPGSSIPTLKYDPLTNKWCSSKSCAQGPELHPLDAKLDTRDWAMGAITDFLTDFTVDMAKGGKDEAGKAERKPPTLLTFAPPNPEDAYAAECKQELDPSSTGEAEGEKKFDLEKMNKVAEELDDENPCKLVGGPDSAAYYPNDLSGAGLGKAVVTGAATMFGAVFPSASDLGLNPLADEFKAEQGVTYTTHLDCMNRQYRRDRLSALATYSKDMMLAPVPFISKLYDYVMDAAVPDMIASPMGVGGEFALSAVPKGIKGQIEEAYTMGVNFLHDRFQQVKAEADANDCGETSTAFRRTFCDLHCIRDAVRKGNKLILDGLGKSVEILNSNLQALFNHYLGGQNSGNLVQILMQGEQVVTAGLAELEAAAQGGVLAPAKSASLRFVAQSFAASWHRSKRALSINGTKATHHMRSLSEQSLALSMTVKSLTSSRLSPAEHVQQQVFLYLAAANGQMHAKLQDLDLYRQSAVRSKHLQHVLLQSAVQQKSTLAKNQELTDSDLLEPLKPQQKDEDHSSKENTGLKTWLAAKFDMMDAKSRLMDAKLDMMEKKMEVNEEEHVSNALEQMDSLWWQLRIQFDKYLDAADGQLQSFKAALTALHAYTSECSTNFASIKDAYAAAARQERRTHNVLKQVWMTMLPLVGELTAKIEDSAYLLLFAQADVRAVDLGEHFGLNTSTSREPSREQFCAEHEHQKAELEKVAHAAVQEGIFGQALRQVRMTLGHLAMLQDRFVLGGLGEAPDAAALLEAAKRLSEAQKSVTDAMPGISESLMRRVGNLCHT
jgi:hypothetical protein